MNNSSSSTMASSKLARRRQGGSLPKETPIMESLTSNDPNANAGGKFFNLQFYIFIITYQQPILNSESKIFFIFHMNTFWLFSLWDRSFSLRK